MLLEFQILFGLLAFLFLAILISNIIKKRRTNKQRSKSLMRCHYCGEPMLESDVFCVSCWKITPKVQEMLNNHPDRKPEFYSNISNGYKQRCPHCKNIHSNFDNVQSIFPDSPIQCCPHCKNYFLDFDHYEWSVCCSLIKFKELFSFWIWFAIVYFILSIAISLSLNWHEIICIIAIYTIIHFLFCYIFHKIIRKKAVCESYMRLQQNPEYPQILVDMGFVTMMDKKYYSLCKTPPHSWKDGIKEILKNAFTFD